MDPNNPRILYAAFWEGRRTPYSLISGGEGSSLYRSTDGGDTWTEITRNEGLPKGVLGKIGVAVSPAQSGRVWALVEAEDGALFRSDDGGDTWQRLNEDGELRRRAWYYTHVFADPRDPETCWVLNLQCWKSVDGGKTFTAVPTPHGDNHDLWIDPANTQRMIEGNDGGACVSLDGGSSWTTLFNQPTAQFYHVTADSKVPYRVYGSQQDNTALSIASMSINGAITSADWFKPGGGESGYIAIRPDNPNVVYAGAIGSGPGPGRLLCYDHATGQQRNITVWPKFTRMGEGARDLKYRLQWTYPVEISPHDPDVLYVGANCLLRSRDGGGSWETVSDDLTRNDPTRQEPSGGPITKDNTGAETYNTIFAFAESPHRQGLFWVGTDDGLVKLSRDEGRTWEDITPKELPEWALISVLDVSRHDPATAYVAATRYKWDDTKPYLYKTNDYGQTWTEITNGIPSDDFTRTVRADPVQPGLLFAGTETGLYVSFDDGGSWQRLQGELPVVPVYDLTIKDDSLILATHGRSFWVLDDLGPFRQIASGRGVDSAVLFQPSPVPRFKVYSGYGGKSDTGISYQTVGHMVVAYKQRKGPDGMPEKVFLDAGKNRPDGVIVTYNLPERPTGEVSLAFLEEDGTEIRRFSSKTETQAAGSQEPMEEGAEGAEASAEPEEVVEEQQQRVPKEAGMNRFVWNLRYPDATKVPEDKPSESFLTGPMVLPGRYQVQLAVNGTSETQTFDVVPDPRNVPWERDLGAQFELLLKINRKVSETHEAINQIRGLRVELESWEKRLKKAEQPDVLNAARDVTRTLKGIEDELIQEKGNSPLGYPIGLNLKLAALAGFVDSADAIPTKQEYEVFDELSGEIDGALARLQTLLEIELPRFNALVRDRAIPAVGPVKEEQRETAAALAE